MLDDILELRSQCILLTELDGKSLRNLVSSLEERFFTNGVATGSTFPGLPMIPS